MNSPEPRAANPVRAFFALPNDSRTKTLGITLLVCLCCSVLVAWAAVALKPAQQRNQALEFQRNIVEVAGLLQDGSSVEAALSRIEAQLIELETGAVSSAFDPTQYNIEAAAKDPKRTTPLAPADDPALIRLRPRFMPVYFVRSADGQSVQAVILPVYGAGLWSRMYGFLALEKDWDTVRGLKFYQQGETPGLGGEIDNPKWRALWQGKQVYDANGQPAIRLVKGHVEASAPGAAHQIDGLSGATLTGRGVEHLINYWLGPLGYGPLLQRLRQQQAQG